MELIRLTVRNFAGIRLAKVEFGPGLNVLYGPNDLGKSTLVAAIRTVLLLPTGSRDRDPYITWNCPDPPQVELVFRTDERRYWKVKKTFASGSKGRASLESSLDGESFSIDIRDSKGVDGKLREILRWGIPGPGHRGAPRGVPQTFLTSALLADQGAVAGLFAQRLGAFKDTSDREMMTEALQVLTQPEEFTRALEIAEARTGEAFSRTGRARRGGQSPLAILREQVLEAEREVHVAWEQYQRGESVRKQIQEFVQRRGGLRTQLTKAKSYATDLSKKKANADTYQELAEDLQVTRTNFARIEQAKRALLSAREQESARGEAVNTISLRLKEAEAEIEAAERAREQTRDAVEQAKLLPDPHAEFEKRGHALLEEERAAQVLVSRASEVGSQREQISDLHAQVKLLEDALPGEREALAYLGTAQRSTEEDLEQWRTFSAWAHLRNEAEVPQRSGEIANLLARAEAEPGNRHSTFLGRVNGWFTDLTRFVQDRDVAQGAVEHAQEAILPSERAVQKATDDLERVGASDSLQPKLEKRLLELEAKEAALRQRIEMHERAAVATERAQELQQNVAVFEAEDLGPLRERERVLRERLEEFYAEHQVLDERSRYLEWKDAAHRVASLEEEVERRGVTLERATVLRAEVAWIEGELEGQPVPSLDRLPVLRSLSETMRVEEVRAQSSADLASASWGIGRVGGALLFLGAVLALGGGGVLAFSAGLQAVYPLVGFGLGIVVTIVALVVILRTRARTSRFSEEAEEEISRLRSQWQKEGQPVLDAAGVNTLEDLEKRIIESQERSLRVRELLREAEGLEDQIASNVDLDSLLETARARSLEFEQDMPQERRRELEASTGNPDGYEDILRRQAASASSLRETEEALGETSLQLAKKQAQFEALTSKLREAKQSADEARSFDPKSVGPTEATAELLRAIDEEQAGIRRQLGDLAAIVEATRTQAQVHAKEMQEALYQAKDTFKLAQVGVERALRELSLCWQRLRELLAEQITLEAAELEVGRERSQQARVALARQEEELEHLRSDLETRQKELAEAEDSLGAPTPEEVRRKAEADLARIRLQRESEAKRVSEEQAKRAEAQTAQEVKLEKATKRLSESRRFREELVKENEELVSDLATVQGELRTRSEEFDDEELSRAAAKIVDLEARLEQMVPPRNPVTEEQLEQADRELKLANVALRELEDQLHHEKGALAQVGGDVAKECWSERQAVKQQLEEREQEMELDYQGWQLLLETLREAESEEADFLGKALVPLLEGRFSQLTNGRYGGLALGPDLDTDGIVVNGDKRDIGALSVGTREQLATLFRLALAEQLGSTLLLDDQLVQSDHERMQWFKRQLRESCQNQQIVVVTCRPNDYLEASELPGLGKSVYSSEEGRVRVVNMASRIERVGAT